LTNQQTMNILFLTQRVPYPPNKGDKLRSFNEIKFLSQRHAISLISLTETPADQPHAAELRRYCQSVDIVLQPAWRSNLQALAALPTPRPLTLAFFYAKPLAELVRRKLRETSYDLLFAYCSSMAQYLEPVPDIPKVIDFVDVDSEKWAQYARFAKFPRSLIYRLESQRLKRYEARIARTFQHGFLVSEKEVERFQQSVCSCSTLSAVSLGVNHAFFQPSEELYTPTHLVFTGAMDYFANVETVLYFVHHILPLIQARVPDVKFYIVGRKPAKALQRLAQTHPNVIVTGYVERVQPYVQQAAAFVAPMRIAQGVQNKILEAMSMGVPVVTNSRGFEGLQAVPGQDLFIADQPEPFAERVVQLMTDRALRQTIARHARHTIETRYDWDTNLAKLEHVLFTVR
jgi:polysaccharide biosynthesis protein PslH